MLDVRKKAMIDVRKKAMLAVRTKAMFAFRIKAAVQTNAIYLLFVLNGGDA